MLTSAPVWFFVISLLSREISGQICVSPNEDCRLFGIENTYYEGKGTVTEGSRIISVGEPVGADRNLETNSLVLIIQIQGATIDYSNSIQYGGSIGTGNGYTELECGQYEFAYVSSVSPTTNGLTIMLQNRVRYNYKSEAETSEHGRYSFQVVAARQCKNAELDGNVLCSPWDGHTGGVAFIYSTNGIYFNGNSINCTGAGFRGGGGLEYTSTGQSPVSNDFVTKEFDIRFGNAIKGEGVVGTPYLTSTSDVAPNQGYPGGDYSRGAPGNAGGGGNEHNGGGGGGGSAGFGGDGGLAHRNESNTNGIGGAAIPVISQKLFLGGGGGAGHTNRDLSPQLGAGAEGGGIVILYTPLIGADSTVDVSGIDGMTLGIDGAPGGGAGGSIVLLYHRVISVGNRLNLIANGGNGGITTAPNHGGGGGGGGGLIIHTGLSGTDINMSVQKGMAIMGHPDSRPALDGSDGFVGEIDFDSNYAPLMIVSCTPTRSGTSSNSPTNSKSPTSSRSHSNSGSVSALVSSSPSSTTTPTHSMSDTSTTTFTPTSSRSYSSTKTASISPSESETPTALSTVTPSTSSTNSLTPSPSPTPTPTTTTSVLIFLPTISPFFDNPQPSRSNFAFLVSQTPSATATEAFNSVTVTLFPDDPGEIIFLPPSEAAINNVNSDDVVSQIINIELLVDGQMVQPLSDVQICLRIDSDADRNRACLSYFDEKKGEWICEDPCLEYSNNVACGLTSHFTNFAILLSGGGSGHSACSSFNNWIFEYGWQDLILIASCAGACCCISFFIILVGIFIPSSHGDAYARARANSQSVKIVDQEYLIEYDE